MTEHSMGDARMDRDTHDPMLTNADTTAVAQLIDTDLNESQRARRLAYLVLNEDWEARYNNRDEEYWVLEERYDALCEAYDGLYEAVSQMQNNLQQAQIERTHYYADDAIGRVLNDIAYVMAEFRPRSEIGT